MLYTTEMDAGLSYQDLPPGFVAVGWLALLEVAHQLRHPPGILAAEVQDSIFLHRTYNTTLQHAINEA